MPRNRVNLDVSLPLEITRQIDILCDQFEAALNSGSGVGLEQYLDRVDPPGRNRSDRRVDAAGSGMVAQSRLIQPARRDPGGKSDTP